MASSTSNPLIRAKKPRRPVASPLIKKDPAVPRPRPVGTSVKQELKEPIPRDVKPALDEAPAGYTDFTLRSCKAEDVRDTRYHIMKFHSRAPVNPATDFTAPVRMHRKDPRNLQFQLTMSEMDERKRSSPGVPEEEDKEEQEGHPKADMSVVAPDGGARKVNRPNRKFRQFVQTSSGNEVAKKLRYEEYYPWVMEDFDGKNTWVGSYEAAQSDAYVLFVFDQDGFRMVPARKWYKMTPRNKYTTLTVEEAEQRMEKKSAVPRWIMRHISEEQQQTSVQAGLNSRRKFRTVDGAESRVVSRRHDDDHDEIDFDEEFADDEEAPIMDGNEEDLKLVEDKIKKEQRNANVIGVAPDAFDEMDVDEDDKSKIDKEGRKLKKSLRALEKNAYYDSDEEDRNPYASEEEEEEEDDKAVKTEEGAPGAPIPLPTKIRSSASPPLLPLPKKVFKNLPPGMAIIQLRPQTLAAFPHGVWNPNVKRSRPDSPEVGSGGESSPKRLKMRSQSPPQSTLAASAASAPVASSSASGSADEGLLTAEDVVSIIREHKVIPIKELLSILKPKLKKHPENQPRLKLLIKEVARLNNGVLVLKERGDEQGV